MRVLIAGGGTGGHLFPGIAIADEFRRRGNHSILFVGTARGIEAKAVPAAGYDLATLDITGIKRMGLLGTLRGLLRLPVALLKSMRIVMRFRPDVVIGVGGYASGPLVFAAAMMVGYPTAIQEQNSVPGITNRLLSKVVNAIFIAFEQAATVFPAKKIKRLGNPVRHAIVEALTSQEAATHGNRVLVVGGSQGAKAVNDLVIGAVGLLQAKPNFPRIVHQAGAKDAERVQALYTTLNASVEVLPFIDNMANAYLEADVIIGRAGALTLAELALAGRPAILIPLPTAADDHQTKNAKQFSDAGAAVLLDQRTATAQDLATALESILGDRFLQVRMSTAMHSLAKPTSTQDIVDYLEKLATRAR